MNQASTIEQNEIDALWRGHSGHNVARWPDSCLIAGLRDDPLDESALDELIRRHWRALFARCRLLSASAKRAEALAKDACVRMLQRRKKLDPQDDFRGEIIAAAFSIWRFGHLLPSRPRQIVDAGGFDSDDCAFSHVDVRGLIEGTDVGLRQLSPMLVDLVLSICLDGESTAEAAQRYNLAEEKIRALTEEAVSTLNTSAAWSCPAIPEPRIS